MAGGWAGERCSLRWAVRAGAGAGADVSAASEAGCPAGRLYRECQPGGGCPFSCTHITQQVGCFSEGCEEGCHCPEGTFQHRLACVQVRTCPPLLALPALPLPVPSVMSVTFADPVAPGQAPTQNTGW